MRLALRIRSALVRSKRRTMGGYQDVKVAGR